MVSRVTKFMRRSSEQGLTLVEVLVAIVVIEIVMAIIAPPILLAGATRLQNQRVEQATQLAQGEIDRIKLMVDRGQTTGLPPDIGPNPIQDAPAPNSTVTTAPTTATQGLSIDVDQEVDVKNKKNPDFVVQTFRTQERRVNNIPVAFWMGVRVYSHRAFDNGANPNLTKPRPLGFTSGENIKSPLAVLYTPIFRSDKTDSLCEYHKFLTLANTCPQNP